jgi:hypothetical protein
MLREQLDGSVIAHVTLKRGIGVALLFGGLTKQSYVDKIGLAVVSADGLHSAGHSWDEIGVNRVGTGR